jgi:PAS domain S-box-containing protein
MSLRIKILLIEDDANDFVILRNLLQETGFSGFTLDRAKTYESGVEAIHRAEHDVILLDYRLGERNGLELLREVSAHGCPAPIIFLTGRGDHYAVDSEALKAGAADYLVKGQINSDLLERSIRYSISRRRAELELKGYRDRFEELVRERTEKLASANHELRIEIAERKKAEENAREQKEFLTTVIESLHHPFYVINADDYTILMANSAAAPKSFSPDITCHELTRMESEPCGGQGRLCPLETIKRTGKPSTTEHFHYDAEGNPRYIEIHGYPIVDRKGKVAQIIEYALDISDRKRVEEELKRVRDDLAKERSLLHAVLDQMPSGVIVAEPSGKIILANEHATEILGRKASHRDEYPEYRACHSNGAPYDPDEYPLNRSLNQGETVIDEEIVLTLPHIEKTLIILASASPVRDLEGNVAAAVLSFQDITERKKAEEELYRRGQEYRALVENSPDVVMRVDRELRRVFANQALETLTGYPISHFIGTTIYEPGSEDRFEYVSLMEKACASIFSTGAEQAFEFPYPTTEGGIRHFHMRLVPEYTKEGEIGSILTISRDITDLRKVQEELRKARDELELRVRDRTAELARSNRALRLDEARLEALWKLSQMAGATTKDIADFTLEQQIKLTGSKAGAIGLMNEEEGVFTLYACTVDIREKSGLVHDPISFPIRRSRLLSECVTKREPIVVREPDRSALDGMCPFVPVTLQRLMIVPIVEGDSVVAVATAGNKDEEYDQSDIRQLTLLSDGMWKLVQRGKAEKALREAESLAAMGRALSAVAHDVKTPLVAIGGFTRMVHDHLDEGSGDRSKLEIVISEVRRLEAMLKDILDFSKPLELDKSFQDVNGLILESLLMVDDVARERELKIETHFADLPPVFCDPTRIKQIIINLVMNAIQASPPGRTVSVSTGIRGKRLLIDVTDCGCGVPVQKRDEIFTPFVSTKKEGTGLGLAISKKIVEAHKGDIQVLSNAEEGATLRVSFPTVTD